MQPRCIRTSTCQLPSLKNPPFCRASTLRYFQCEPKLIFQKSFWIKSGNNSSDTVKQSYSSTVIQYYITRVHFEYEGGLLLQGDATLQQRSFTHKEAQQVLKIYHFSLNRACRLCKSEFFAQPKFQLKEFAQKNGQQTK